MQRLSVFADALLGVGAATRLTRFVVTEDLGGWVIREPARHWAESRQWSGTPLTWQSKLVSGLDCPFCVGTWLHLGAQTANAVLPRTGPLRTAYRVLCAGLTASWVMAHIGVALGDAGYAEEP